MDVLEFVSSLVGSLAWPVAVVVLVWVLRPELKHLAAGGVRRWKAGPVEIEYWDRERSEVRESIRRELPAAVGEGGELAAAGGLVEELAEVVEAAPAAAVLEAFTRIEVELRRIVEAGGVEADGLERMAARQLAHVAFRHGLVTAESVNAVEGLPGYAAIIPTSPMLATQK